MAKKVTPIKYTAREFESIKAALVEHAKRYYPDTFQDFSEASFGSLLLDTVSYVGDVLSFYLDYQVNESFLDSAIEYNNVIRVARQMGYQHRSSYTSAGLASFYVVVPRVGVDMGPDPDYIPTLKRGTLVTTDNGTSFMLNEDIDFADAAHKVIVAAVDSSTGSPTDYAIRAYGEVVSGEMKVQREELGVFVPMRKLLVDDVNVSEVVRVFDSEGHEYIEVDYLSQDIVYRKIINRTRGSDDSPLYIMKPEAAPRRFTVVEEDGSVYLQFGYGSDSTLKDKPVTRASDVILKTHGKDYVTSKHYDPSRLNENDKLGVGPSDTELSIVFRSNSRENVNVGARAITSVLNPLFEFKDRSRLNELTLNNVITSLEVVNEEPITGDISLPTVDEIRTRALDHYAAQNRAVTLKDYQSLVYRMPPAFGAVKHCVVTQDLDSVRRNLNLHIVSENSNGFLIEPNEKLKQNLKTWISDYKMVNDTVDILNAKIVNIGVEFEVVADPRYNKYDVVSVAKLAVVDYFAETSHTIGESLYVTDLYKALNDTNGVMDVVTVRLISKNGSQYSSQTIDILKNMSADGRILHLPPDCILEMKYPNSDIKGTVK